MERYYEIDRDTNRRTRKNADLYQKIYENDEYSNIEGIATTLKPNEIDISKIKEMLKNRDEYQKERDIRNIIAKPEPILRKEEPVASFDQDDEKNYDIRDILSKAKNERKNPAESYHKLTNTSYDIFKNLNIKNKKEETREEGEEELKELIHTITNTSMLNKLGDQELSLGLLDDLKSDTMVGDASSIEKILNEEKESLKDDNYLDDEKQNMDKSFFTSSLNFRDEDFDELQEMSHNLKKNNRLMKVLIFILLVVATASIIFFLLK